MGPSSFRSGASGGVAILPVNPWRRYGGLALSAALLGWGAWRLAPRRVDARFPRKEMEHLPQAELVRRLEAATERLVANPQDMQALLDAGILHFQRGRSSYPDAINALEEARKLGVLDSRVFYYLGVMYQEEGLYPFAMTEYRRFLRHHPKDRETRLLLAKLLYQSGDYVQAAALYQGLRADFPRDPLVQEHLALSLWALERREEAAELFRSLGEHGETEGRRSHFHLGRMAVEGKEHQKAADHFAFVLPLEGRAELGIPKESVYAAVAANCERLDRPEQAKRHWEQVLRHNPQNARAKAALKSLSLSLRKSQARKKKR